MIAGIMQTRGVAPAMERLLVTTGSQQGLDLVARVLLDPGDVVLVELPSYTGRDHGVPERPRPDGGDSAGGRRNRPCRARLDPRAARRRRQARAFPVRHAKLSESDRPADGPPQAAAAARVGRVTQRADRRRRSVSRTVLRGLRIRSGRPPDEGRRWRGTRHLFEQLFEDARAGLPRRVDRRAGADRRQAGDGQAGWRLVHGRLRSAYRPRVRTAGDSRAPVAACFGATTARSEM